MEEKLIAKLDTIEALLRELTVRVQKIEEAVFPEDQVLTQKEVCRLLGLSERTFKRMRDTGSLEIPYQQTARKILFKKSDVMGWLQNRA
ncbi:MAG: helix-turn-helix domain-containing protein [Candidatus Cloacimonetes bacterium]|nr:helix-turn-helix domain-containing protein [Candidatus Cloacimonadota bacterium]